VGVLTTLTPSRLLATFAGCEELAVTPRQYEITVRGDLGKTMRSAFPALRASPRGKDTVLTGALADQAALHGVLAEIGALGLELLEVHRLPPW
jgi:hypothetical protein